jgi:hypothetical protein
LGAALSCRLRLRAKTLLLIRQFRQMAFPFHSVSGELRVALPIILPVGFISAPGALSFTVTNPDLGPVISNPFPYPATIAPTLALCATPSPTTVFANSSFSFTVQPSEVNLSGNGTLTLGSLPVGITSTNSSATLPPSGTTVHLQAASTTAAGPYDLTLNGSAGTATAKGDFNFTVSTGTPPSFVSLHRCTQRWEYPSADRAVFSTGQS